jgi:hypothetical protein
MYFSPSARSVSATTSLPNAGACASGPSGRSIGGFMESIPPEIIRSGVILAETRHGTLSDARRAALVQLLPSCIDNVHVPATNHPAVET